MKLPKTWNGQEVYAAYPVRRKKAKKRAKCPHTVVTLWVRYVPEYDDAAEGVVCVHCGEILKEGLKHRG